MEQSYLIILGDIGNKHYARMLERALKIGVPTQLLENVYALTLHDNVDLQNMEDVRNYIAGDEFGYCIVVTINSGFTCAWNLTKSRSEIFTGIVNGQKDKGK